MRREDRQCNDPDFLNYVLDNAEVIFLAMNDGEYPCCLPLNFARSGASLYIHSAPEGHKLDLLRRDSRVAFATAVDISIQTQKSTTWYKSVCGRGRACIVEDAAEKRTALDLISDRYRAQCKKPASPAAVKRVAIIRIDIENMTGKRHLP